MKSGIKLARRRLATAKFIVEFFRHMVGFYLKNPDHFGSSVDEMVLCLAAAVGQLEGRPMTAAKLAMFVGIPRASVIRKLKALTAIGAIKRLPNGTYKMSQEVLNSPAALRLSDLLEAMFMHRQLQSSKMDNDEVASVKPDHVATTRKKK